MLDRLPFYGQVLVFVGFAVAIVGGVYYAQLGDMRGEIAKLEEELAVKNQEISEGLAIEQRLPEFEREIAQLEMKLGDVQQILPTGRETGTLLAWVKNLGDQSNLDLKSFDPGVLRPVEFYQEFPIEMQVIARYHDLGLFLDRVSKYSRIINVDNLRINASRGQPGKTIQASFTATTFVYDGQRPVEESE
ncbi:MAG: type 4a pilus biogenesis protein PilO [Acidobacteriota bacterium]|nr:type 4a pilus biogenesis protein PilO [Acidobacteriota bacterium]